MKKKTMPQRAIMSTIAISLAMTMTPAAAWAADSAASSAADMAGVVDESILENISSSSSTSDVAIAETATFASSSANTDADANASALPVIREQAIEEDAKLEVVSVTVAVAEDAEAATIISQNGLLFQIDTIDGVNTASLVGVATQATQTSLVVPETIGVADVTYSVTNICTLGGGVRTFKL